MKYIKTYEKKSRIPKLNDYVICVENNVPSYKFDYGYAKPVMNFVNNNIGKIVRHEPHTTYPYLVEFEDVIPEKIKKFFTTDNCRGFKFNEIIDWDTNKEDLESRIMAKKYNL